MVVLLAVCVAVCVAVGLAVCGLSGVVENETTLCQVAGATVSPIFLAQKVFKRRDARL